MYQHSFFANKGITVTSIENSNKKWNQITDAVVLDRFKIFDKEALRISTSTPPKDLAQSAKILKGLIDVLPQREAIKDEDAARWLERTFTMAVGRMELEHGDKATVSDVHKHVFWHIRRASAFGGSEVAVLLADMKGEKGTFSDGRTLVMEKLLMMSPQQSTPEMSRGVRAEPWIQRMYHEQNNCKTDEEGLNKLMGFRWDKRPAMVGTPDDYIIHADGTHEIPDYKAPSGDVCDSYEKDGVSFDYICQIHHYCVLAMAAGVKFDTMSVRVHDPRSFTITKYPVVFDKLLAKQLCDATTQYWGEFVMQGKLPELRNPPVLELEDEDIKELGYQVTGLNLLGKEIEKRITDLRGRISALAGDWYGKSIGSMGLDVATFARTRKWDEEKLVAIATAAGIELDGYSAKTGKIDVARINLFIEDMMELGDNDAEIAKAVRENIVTKAFEGDKLDVAALADALEAQGICTVEAAEVAEAFRISTKKKGPEAEKLNEVKDEIADLADTVEEIITAFTPRIRLNQVADVDVEDMGANMAL
jgi:hypothetical protein